MQMRKLKPEEMKYASSYNHPRQHLPNVLPALWFWKCSAKSKGNKEVRGGQGRPGRGQRVHRAQGTCSQVNFGKPNYHVTLLDSQAFQVSAVKNLLCQHRGHRRCSCDPWLQKMPWRRKWPPAPVSLPGKSPGQRSLVGCSTSGVLVSRPGIESVPRCSGSAGS